MLMAPTHTHTRRVVCSVCIPEDDGLSAMVHRKSVNYLSTNQIMSYICSGWAVVNETDSKANKVRVYNRRKE